MRLATAELDRYGPLRDCRPAWGDGLTIVAGPNESGKTLYLEGLLQLLDPDVAGHMSPRPRVDGDPTGRVVLANGNEHHELGNGTAVGDVTPLTPAHLERLFVVRDSDLALPAGTDYYTSLVEQLGDVHTSAIEAIRDELVDVGRLTPKTLNVASREYDTADVRDDAAALADRVESYLDSVAAEGVDEAVSERLRCRRELATVEDRLEIQRTADAVATVETARDELAAYAAATDALPDSEGVDRETLDELREYTYDLEHERERIERIDADLDRRRTDRSADREDLATARERHAEFQQREGAVERAAEALSAYRERPGGINASQTSANEDGSGQNSASGDSASESDAGGSDSIEARLTLRRRVAVGAVLGSGVAAAAAAVADAPATLAVGGVLAVVGFGSWLSHRRLSATLSESAEREAALLRAARDAGFEVDTPGDVAPALRDYRDELTGLTERISTLEARIDEADTRIAELETARAEAAETRRQLAARIDETLQAAGVDSVDAFEAKLDKQESRTDQQTSAAAVLRAELGDPPAEDPHGQIEFWEDALAARERDLDAPDVDPEAYDEAEHERLQDRRDELTERVSNLEADLAAFRDRLDEFDREVAALDVPPFVDCEPTLQARTVEGLGDLATALRDLVAEIERNAAVSRKAIGVLDDIDAAEQQKITTLFDPSGPATEAFARLTDGRYAAVDYDPDGETLQVERSDGQTLAARRLSRGTRDQLYFAARLSLAQQLLGGEPGFLLLDDPFLAADRERLRNGFRTLSDLAGDGWQLLYLTAKHEVHEEMAAEFDVPVCELDPLAD